MEIINGYATLQEFKDWKELDGIVTQRDNVIKQIISSVSRYIDDRTTRTFYPRVEIHYFDMPEEEELCLDDDLLEVLTLTNGDSSVISSTAYNLVPKNKTPHFAIELKDNSNIVWMATTDDDYIVSVSGIWGYHKNYAQRGFVSAGTLGAAISDATTLSVTMTTGHTVKQGKLYRIGNELMQVSSVSTNAVTLVSRGDNGSTAAAHDNGSTVYEWLVMDDIKAACLTVAHNLYSRRFGENVNNVATVTGAGVVIQPRDVPPMVDQMLNTYKRMT